MFNAVKSAFIRPEKYRDRLIASLLPNEDREKARLEALKDKQALDCEGCKYRYGMRGGHACRWENKEEKYPDWAGGKNMCLRYATERLGFNGWIMPSGDPFIITKEAAQSIANALADIE